MVRVLRAGDVEGDVEVLLGTPTPYAARTLEDTRVLFVPAHCVRTLLREHPALTHRWLTGIAARLQAGHAHLAAVLSLPLDARLARLLCDHARDDVVTAPQATLAALLGVRRPSLNRLLGDWDREGIISVGYGRVRLLDADRLATLARG